jgi:7-carboxy-7-deazaguanine synthase
MCLANLDLLEAADTVKFVAGSAEDLQKALQVIREYRLTEKCYVYLSPVFGAIRPAEMVDFMKQNRLNDVRLQLQMHKFIWDPDRRGV